ncbi:MAG TPA: M28 family peptidase [Saprospiraceae bacterium]|nr:M28 family peptidase [Saprospiraceae bacterium]
MQQQNLKANKLFHFLMVLCLFLPLRGLAQVVYTEGAKIKRDIYFLASDELEGRMTGEKGNLVAARYIAEEFRKLGIVSPAGVDDYFQVIEFEKRIPARDGFIKTKDTLLHHTEEILIMSGAQSAGEYPLVFAGQGWADDETNDYEGLDVHGKWVLVTFGKPGSVDPRDGFFASIQKREWAKDRGALGMIEIYRSSFPWPMIKRFLGREQTSLSSGSSALADFQYVLSDYAFSNEIAFLRNGEEVKIQFENSGVKIQKLYSPNVIGWIQGNDSAMSDEYLILSAHYDHIGVGEGEGDVIFNGARDNAMGTAAILAAARHFAKNPPSRSLLIIALTGEEIGLLGSDYYVRNPVKPLHKAILNLNTDGAGYNATDRVNVIGHDRVGVLEILTEAASKAGLALYGDPAPEQNLFDRSDNASFARIGIPAPSWSPGMTSFDQEILKYYHQPGDHADTLDYDYIEKFVKGYIIAVEKIANWNEKPRWREGDKYEEAAKRLYGSKN